MGRGTRPRVGLGGVSKGFWEELASMLMHRKKGLEEGRWKGRRRGRDASGTTTEEARETLVGVLG